MLTIKTQKNVKNQKSRIIIYYNGYRLTAKKCFDGYLVKVQNPGNSNYIDYINGSIINVIKYAKSL